MNRRVVQQEDGSYGLIEDTNDIRLTIEGAADVAEIDDEETWEALRKTNGKRDKIKKIIGTQMNES